MALAPRPTRTFRHVSSPAPTFCSPPSQPRAVRRGPRALPLPAPRARPGPRTARRRPSDAAWRGRPTPACPSVLPGWRARTHPLPAPRSVGAAAAAPRVGARRRVGLRRCVCGVVCGARRGVAGGACEGLCVGLCPASCRAAPAPPRSPGARGGNRRWEQAAVSRCRGRGGREGAWQHGSAAGGRGLGKGPAGAERGGGGWGVSPERDSAWRGRGTGRPPKVRRWPRAANSGGTEKGPLPRGDSGRRAHSQLPFPLPSVSCPECMLCWASGAPASCVQPRWLLKELWQRLESFVWCLGASRFSRATVPVLKRWCKEKMALSCRNVIPQVGWSSQLL